MWNWGMCQRASMTWTDTNTVLKMNFISCKVLYRFEYLHIMCKKLCASTVLELFCLIVVVGAKKSWPSAEVQCCLWGWDRNSGKVGQTSMLVRSIVAFASSTRRPYKLTCALLNSYSLQLFLINHHIFSCLTSNLNALDITTSHFYLLQSESEDARLHCWLRPRRGGR